MISEISGSQPSLVSTVIAGMTLPCRTQKGTANGKVWALGTIQRAAMDYCGADASICEGAITESVEVMFEKFGRVSIPEITEAFKMAAAGQLGQVNIIAYNGVFTVAIFGGVMSAYCIARDKIAAAAINQFEAEKREAREFEKAAQLEKIREEIVEKFQVLTEQNNDYPHYSKVPHWWAKTLIEKGLIASNSDIWLNSKKTAVENFITELEQSGTGAMISEKSKRLLYYKIKAEPDIFPEELRNAATLLYSRMLIFSYFAEYVEPTQAVIIQ